MTRAIDPNYQRKEEYFLMGLLIGRGCLNKAATFSPHGTDLIKMHKTALLFWRAEKMHRADLLKRRRIKRLKYTK